LQQNIPAIRKTLQLQLSYAGQWGVGSMPKCLIFGQQPAG
jgi:hypothetical protein